MPHAQTHIIFSIIPEPFPFIPSPFLLIIFFFFIYPLLLLIHPIHPYTPFPSFFSLRYTPLILIHTFQNIPINIAVIPLT
ncbi:FtsW/RodA/SpoVE family cell cycle protein, partial [Bacillus pumilus]|uniref:FtsW/RodA/SpoVE family cell cycle protein n=1 Tax=Bacillus pumilus TaxID=1408 RepID=UPI0034D96FAB